MRKHSSQISPGGRSRRVAALLKRELAALMQRELNDPRTAKATLTGVDVAPDLSHAKVYVTHLVGRERGHEIVAALNKAEGFVRRRLAGRIKLRVVPELRFLYDESVERGMAISALIDRARAQDRDDKV
ncbi:MAG TPA: 30S ribosome-binding factor RbfA [Acidiferrobacterales bacterium]|nr:30S ribosome-binding factor RbfA [Acidiferrobacterales bacterium]